MHRILIALMVVFSACDRPPPPKAEAPTELADEITYPLAEARYLYLNEEERPCMVATLDDVPLHLRGEAAVLAGELTQTPDDKTYVYADYPEGRNLGKARLIDTKAFEHNMAVAWIASGVPARSQPTATPSERSASVRVP